MNKERSLDVFVTSGERLTNFGSTNALDIAVPSCPGWNVGQLIHHCAAIWSSVEASIEAGGRADQATVVTPSDPVGWHAETHRSLVDYLSARDSDEPCWSFVEPSTMSFWHRRMAQESSLHCWDADNAVAKSRNETTTPIDTDVAIDSIDELLDYFIAQRNPATFAGNGETLHLHAADDDTGAGEWVITRTQTGIEVEHAHAKCDVAARGTASDLSLMLWNRIGPGHLEVFGQAELLDEWQRVVRI